jgi:glycosyltransferase involved in cell wall biosynthesis
MNIAGQMAISGISAGRPFPLWKKCLANLRDRCDGLYLRFDALTGNPAVPEEIKRICGSKLKELLVSKTVWNQWNWREEMLRMLDHVKPDIVLTPDQDEEFGPGLLDELYRFTNCPSRALMFIYTIPMPTCDGSLIWRRYPGLPHMKAYKWRPGLTYVPYQSCAQVRQYATPKVQLRAETQILHYCYWSADLRKARARSKPPSPKKAKRRSRRSVVKRQVQTDKPYSVRLLYDARGWAYYHRCTALMKYAPEDFYVDIGGDYGRAMQARKYDLVLQLAFPYAGDLRAHLDECGYDTVLVTGYNVAWEHAKDWFEKARGSSDHMVINSRACWEGAGKPGDATWISNGVDRDIYQMKIPPQQRTARVLWTASRFHLGVKGYKDLLVPLAKRLDAAGIAHDFRVVQAVRGRGWRPPADLADWYNSGTIYVVGSKHEATPNPALESASAGCVVVSSNVGNMPELIESGVNGEIVERDVNAFYEAIVRCQARYCEMSQAMQERIAVWDWRDRSTQYYDLFRRLIDARRNGKEQTLLKEGG